MGVFFVCLNIIKLVIKRITPPNTIQVIFQFESNSKQHGVYADFKTIQALAHIPVCTYNAKLTSKWLVRFVYIDL